MIIYQTYAEAARKAETYKRYGIWPGIITVRRRGLQTCWRLTYDPTPYPRFDLDHAGYLKDPDGTVS